MRIAVIILLAISSIVYWYWAEPRSSPIRLTPSNRVRPLNPSRSNQLLTTPTLKKEISPIDQIQQLTPGIAWSKPYTDTWPYPIEDKTSAFGKIIGYKRISGYAIADQHPWHTGPPNLLMQAWPDIDNKLESIGWVLRSPLSTFGPNLWTFGFERTTADGKKQFLIVTDYGESCVDRVQACNFPKNVNLVFYSDEIDQ